LSTGTVALLIKEGPGYLLDMRVILSFVAAILYVVYFIRRMKSLDDGAKLAMWNLLGYALLVIGFFASSVTSFHRWI